LAAFAFGVIEPARFAQRLIKIVVDGLKVHSQALVHPAFQFLDLKVGEIDVILAGKGAVGD
jgi:hypothetical protein